MVQLETFYDMTQGGGGYDAAGTSASTPSIENYIHPCASKHCEFLLSDVLTYRNFLVFYIGIIYRFIKFPPAMVAPHLKEWEEQPFSQESCIM